MLELAEIQIVPIIEENKLLYYRTVVFDVSISSSGTPEKSVSDIFHSNTLSAALSVLQDITAERDDAENAKPAK